jgi:hypothetical protein
MTHLVSRSSARSVSVRVVRVALSTTVIALLVATQATAYDSYPCGRRTSITMSGRRYDVQYCPLWRGNVPVLKDPWPGSRVVGYLTYGGSANWFSYQCPEPDKPYRLGKYWNTWYGYTMADNGQWGFVSEVYFSGGKNNERDRGLIQQVELLSDPAYYRCSDWVTVLAD